MLLCGQSLQVAIVTRDARLLLCNRQSGFESLFTGQGMYLSPRAVHDSDYTA